MRRRQPRQSTQGRIVINKVGRSLGPWDEKPLSDADEDYDSDDGFVVADSETDTDADQDQDQSSTEESVFEQMSGGEESEVLDDGDYDVVQQSSMVVGTMTSDDEATPQKDPEKDMRRQAINLMNGSDDGSDSDLPTLETTFRTPRKRRLVRRRAVDSDADTPTRRSNTRLSDSEDNVSGTPTQTTWLLSRAVRETQRRTEKTETKTRMKMMMKTKMTCTSPRPETRFSTMRPRAGEKAEQAKGRRGKPRPVRGGPKRATTTRRVAVQLVRHQD